MGGTDTSSRIRPNVSPARPEPLWLLVSERVKNSVVMGISIPVIGFQAAYKLESTGTKQWLGP